MFSSSAVVHLFIVKNHNIFRKVVDGEGAFIFFPKICTVHTDYDTVLGYLENVAKRKVSIGFKLYFQLYI